MLDKNRNNKTRSTKNKKEVLHVPAKVTADIVGCSVSTVKKVRTDVRTDESTVGQTVKLVDQLLYEGSSLLLKEVKKRVRI